jgi:flagellin
MRINHNIAALNTYRQLSTNNTNGSKSLEKLSSGLRINRAGDDAAGLAISEKMRGQIRGLDQASKNAQDGISLVQTAEGALNEVHSILQRMRELAVQSASDTNTSGVDSDRAQIQKEVSQLREEIDRIANSTQFNTMALLKGDFAVKLDETTANSTLLADGSYVSMSFSGLGAGTWALTFDTDHYTLSNGTTTLISDTEPTGAGVINFGGPTGESVSITVNDSYATGALDTLEFVTTGSSGLKLQIGANANQSMTLTLGDMRITGGSSAAMTALAGVDLTTQAGANAAVTVIQTAIDFVSSERATMGAVQNRLEHTINNLGTSSENLSASESRIRDVDMAKEMMEYTKNSILTQAATAMLAQANQAPQAVLQLLQ